MDNSKEIISWQTPEFDHYPKEKSWFLVLGFLSVVLLIWAVLTKNYIFSLFIVLGFFSLLVYGAKKPRMIEILINSKGIKADKTFYPFDNLRSFWIFYDPDEGIKELSLKSKKSVMPYIKISLNEQDPVELRKFLSQFIPEKKQDESVIDDLSRRIRF